MRHPSSVFRFFRPSMIKATPAKKNARNPASAKIVLDKVPAQKAHPIKTRPGKKYFHR